jgi:hypothetical protein
MKLKEIFFDEQSFDEQSFDEWSAHLVKRPLDCTTLAQSRTFAIAGPQLGTVSLWSFTPFLG